MSKKLVYPPIKMVDKIKSVCPGIDQKYAEFEKENSNDASNYNIAIRTALYYYPTYSEADIQRALKNRKVSTHVIQNMRKTQTKAYADEREWSAARIAALMEWRKEKHVYKLSNKFFEILRDAEDTAIDISMFDSLPHNCFYIECEGNKDIHGMFVYYINNTSESSSVILMPIDAKADQHSLIAFNLTQGSTITDAVCPLNEEFWKNLATFAVHALMYICSRDNDIVEDAEQKTIYRKSNRIHDKYSEVQKWDVGYNIISNDSIVSRPHWRKYRVGKGRQKIALRFAY